jgi:hypothetical protein
MRLVFLEGFFLQTENCVFLSLFNGAFKLRSGFVVYLRTVKLEAVGRWHTGFV